MKNVMYDLLCLMIMHEEVEKVMISMVSAEEHPEQMKQSILKLL